MELQNKPPTAEFTYIVKIISTIYVNSAEFLNDMKF